VNDGDAKKKIIREIFFQKGASLNIELVRQGIAPCEQTARLPPRNNRIWKQKLLPAAPGLASGQSMPERNSADKQQSLLQ